MKQLLVPTLLVATAAPVFAQAQLDADLLFPTHLIAPPTYTGSECDLRKFVCASTIADVSPLQQQMLVRLANQLRTNPEQPAGCWAKQPSPRMYALWTALMAGQQFNPVTRWSTTATQGGGLNQGDPTVLTYSFVPDGTVIPAALGAPAGSSTLFATFNAAFPSQATWQDRVGDALNRWGELCGITYVYEPNDDGAQLSSAPGVLGIRGDLRIACHPHDGPSNTLAYNAFPNNGDMVLDADDIGLFDNAGANYLSLFNVIAHEHGHGMGIAHVCPIQQTKLMEPIFTTSLVGPQFDDILTSQRLYGDTREPNDNTFQATDLGTLGNGTDFTTMLSLDDNSDTDWFRFTTTTSHLLTVTLTPSGSPYLEGDQNSDSSCQPGTTFDPRALRNVAFDIVGTNGSTVLQSVDTGPAGTTETSAQQLISLPGTYYIRVYGDGANTIQMYDLDVALAAAPGFTIEILGGAPDTIPSDAPSAVDIRAIPGTTTANPNFGVMFTRINGGPFTSQLLQYVGGNDFRGLLPAASCFDQIEWYVSLVPQIAGPAVFAPLGAPTTTFSTEVLNLPLTTIFADNFETDQGWTVADDAALTDGTWDRGLPLGGGDRGDPATDADGSGQCYLTDRADGNTDVDGGATSLLSPIFDLSGQTDAIISWSYWYTNNAGAAPGQDVWVTEISADGGLNWTQVSSTTASTSDWVDTSIRVSDFVPLSSLVRMRFTASDPAPGAVVEAGLDAFLVATCPPSPTELLPGACAGPFTSSTISTDLAPTAGTTINIECEVVSQVSGPVFVGFVLGFTQVGVPLPSCGCTVHPSLDALDIGIATWSSPAAESWSLPFAIPPGTAGAEIFVQGLVAGLGSNTCAEAGLPLNLTDALRITVQ